MAFNIIYFLILKKYIFFYYFEIFFIFSFFIFITLLYLIFNFLLFLKIFSNVVLLHSYVMMTLHFEFVCFKTWKGC